MGINPHARRKQAKASYDVMNTIDILIQTRTLLHGAVANLSETEWLAIPDRFDNNIAWNVGHINVVQQSLIYRLSGLPTYSEKVHAKMYLPNTSPATWAELGVQPDIPLLIEQTATFAELLKQDYEAGKFEQFNAYTTGTGTQMNSVEDAIAFNNFHEGLHLGMILSIRNLI